MSQAQILHVYGNLARYRIRQAAREGKIRQVSACILPLPSGAERWWAAPRRPPRLALCRQAHRSSVQLLPQTDRLSRPPQYRGLNERQGGCRHVLILPCGYDNAVQARSSGRSEPTLRPVRQPSLALIGVVDGGAGRDAAADAERAVGRPSAPGASRRRGRGPRRSCRLRRPACRRGSAARGRISARRRPDSAGSAARRRRRSRPRAQA
jgi:hypothetical protein